MSNDDVHALAGAYALDALDPLERRRFEAHYPDCEACRTEVAGFRETTARLSPVATPSPELRDRVLAEVGRTRQLPPTVATAGRPWLRPAILAVAAVVALLLVAGVVLTRDRPGGADVAEILAAADATTVDLDGGPGTLRVVYSAELDRAALVGDGLDAPSAGRTYQLWALGGEGPASAGVFDVDDGAVDAPVELPSAGAQGWAVTIEPDGGSAAPTTDILYRGAVES